MKQLFFFVILCAAVLSGYWTGKKPVPKRLPVHPEKEFPLAETKSFAVVIYASNDALWCTRSLRSLFEQEYEAYRVVFIDDGSEDLTYEIARSFILENNQDHRAILVRNEEPIGPIASLDRAIEALFDLEIVMPLSAKDWIALPSALATLNRAYQNPDVWATFSPSIAYPSYEKKTSDSLSSFYAALFRQIRPDDLQQSQSCQSYTKPLLDLSGGRIRTLDAPLTFVNQSLARYEPPEAMPPSYSPLAQFPRSSEDTLPHF